MSKLETVDDDDNKFNSQKESDALNTTNNEFVQLKNEYDVDYDNKKTNNTVCNISDISIGNNDGIKNEFQKTCLFMREHSFISKKCFVNIFFLLLNSLSLSLNFYSVILYSKTLEPCKGTHVHCLTFWDNKKFLDFGYKILIASSLSAVVFTMATLGLVSKFHIIYPCIMYYSLFIMDHDANLIGKHGYLSFKFMVICSIIFYCIAMFVSSFIVLCVKKKYKCFLILTTITFISGLIFFIHIMNVTNCKEFYTGVGGVKIQNEIDDNNGCQFKYPNERCYNDFFHGIFDLSKIQGNTCESIKEQKFQRGILQAWLPKEMKKVDVLGFPITTTKTFSLRTQQNVKAFSERVLNNMVDMEKYNENSGIPKPEVTLNFSSKNPGKIDIKINYNETLAKSRFELGQKYKSKYDNILIIYIDSMSRMHFKRKMKKLTKFLENYILHDEDELNEIINDIGNKEKKRYKEGKKNAVKREEQMNAFQFLKYHNYEAFTQKNVQPMFYGEKMDKNNSNGTHIIKYFKERGFVTAQSNDLCHKELFAAMNNCLNRAIFSDFDHENVAMFCDPNYYNRDKPYPFLQGGFSIIRKCLYNRDAYEYVIEYGKKFWEAYKDNKKLLRIAFIDAHERTGEVIKYLDSPLYSFLSELKSANLLINTIIMMVSDHGNGMPIFFTPLNTRMYNMEMELGFLYFVFDRIDDHLNKDEIKELYNNQQKLMSPYDIFDTLSHILYNEVNMTVHTRNNLGQSMLLYLNSKPRTCKTWPEMPDNLCRCLVKP